MAKKQNAKGEDVKVVPELEISWPGGKETVKTFDVAWHRVMDRAREHGEASSKFLGVARVN